MMSRRALATLLTLGIVTTSFDPAHAQVQPLVLAEQQYQQLYDQRQYAAALPFAERALELALNDPTLSDEDHIELLDHVCELYYLDGDYSRAEGLARQVLAVRLHAPEFDPYAIAVTEEDIAELLDLEGRDEDGSALHQRAKALLNGQRRGQTVASSIGRQDTVVKQSVLDFYAMKQPEDRGYGRYTYVLFPVNATSDCDRCRQLLASIADQTPIGPVSPGIRATVNVFEVPVSPGHRDDTRNAFATSSSASSAVTKVLAQYDYGSANILVTRGCARYREATGKFCTTLDEGPYLIAYPRPVSNSTTLPTPYLIVDMSYVNPRAYHFFIERVKQQVAVGNLKDESRINDTFTRVVSIVLDAADILEPTTKAITEWVKIVKQ